MNRRESKRLSKPGASTLGRLTAPLAVIFAIALILFAVGFATNAGAQTAPDLGAAESYAVLGGQTVTNTGPTTINGDLGVSPGTEVTGFPPGIVSNGSIHQGDAHALQAQGAATTAYNALAAQPCTADLTGQDLGGMTLTEGVYCFSSSAQLTGQLTLNAQGNADAVFIFKMVSMLTTASDSSVQVTNGGVDCNVFWQVGSSATIGTGTEFVGNILALTSIALQTGASVSGRALALNGAVTLDSNDVSFEACGASTATASPTASATVTAAPTATATPSDTAAPTATATPSVTAPATATATASATPTPTPTATPTATPVGQTPTPAGTPTGPTPRITPDSLPRTGDSSLESSAPWWTALLVAFIVGTLGAVALALSLTGWNAGTHSRRE